MTQDQYELRRRLIERQMLSHTAAGNTYTTVLKNLQLLENVYSTQCEEGLKRANLERNLNASTELEIMKVKFEILKLEKELVDIALERKKKDGIPKATLFNGAVSLVEFVLLLFGQDLKYVPKNMLSIIHKPKL